MSGVDDVYEVRLSQRALSDLRDIRNYIAGSGAPRAADRHAARLLRAIDRLERLPYVGRSVGGGIRELTTVPPHIIQYEIAGRIVEVLTIRHGARRPTD